MLGATNGERLQHLLFEAIERDGNTIGLVTLNRPEQRNPVDKETIRELRDVLERVNAYGRFAAVILTGAGETFSAGGDLKGYQTLYRDAERFQLFMDDFAVVCDVLERGPVISIAMINGTCVAGGLELSLACDFVTISDDARIGDGHLRFAQLPGAGGSQRLVRAIGPQRAKHWLLTGDLFPASAALEAGLAIVGASPESLQERTLELACRVGKLSPDGLRTMKSLIATATTSPLREGLEIEQRVVRDYATESHDAMEGLIAFAERRDPVYLPRDGDPVAP